MSEGQTTPECRCLAIIMHRTTFETQISAKIPQNDCQALDGGAIIWACFAATAPGHLQTCFQVNNDGRDYSYLKFISHHL